MVLPSPAVSTINSSSEKGKTRSTDETPSGNARSSWIWQWIEIRKSPQGEERMYCKIKKCPQKEGWTMKGNSRSGPKKHLENVHKLSERDSVTTSQTPSGPLQRAFAKHGQTSFSPEKWRHALCELQVHNKLPYTFFESPYLKNLIHLAHAAPSQDHLMLPSDDAMRKQVQLVNKISLKAVN